MADHLDIEQIHKNFVERYLRDEGKKVAEEIRRMRASGESKPVPEPEHRNAHRISDAIQNIVVGNARCGELESVHNETQ